MTALIAHDYKILTASAVLKGAGPGGVAKVIVNTAGAGCTINDCATVAAAASGNQIFAVPDTLGIYELNCPIKFGLVVVVAGSASLTVTYE